jgi:phosphoglycerate dehydrogenase-like enzyme
MKVAVLDDWQGLSGVSADWSYLNSRAKVSVFTEPFASEAATAKAIADCDILLPMRERTALGASFLSQLPKLKMIALTGARAQTLDLDYCNAHGITVSNTGGDFVGNATPELAWGLILACARGLNIAETTVRNGGWNAGVPNGIILKGKRLGILGLGKLGSQIAKYGQVFGMEVVAWSENLTADKCAALGVTYVSKQELFSTSDVISLHLVLSARSKHIVGKTELALMKQDAILVNTSRGALVDEAALVAAISAHKIRAGLDVFEQEPLPANHVLRTLANVVLSPHLGYSAAPVFKQFYSESIENILAYINGQPIRLLTKK